MKKSGHYTCIVVLTILIVKANLFGQVPNAYKFIEPNSSFSYDSNFFKIGNHYSNESWGQESYDFYYKVNNSEKARFHISGQHPVAYLSKKEGDSIMAAGIEMIKMMSNDTFSIVNFDKKVRNVKGFSCVGFVGFDKTDRSYGTFIKCNHLSDRDYTEMDCLFRGNKDLDSAYRVLTSFLSGFKSYSAQQIKTEDSVIRNRYTVVVHPAKAADDFKGMPATYSGVVSVEQRLEHKISEVRIALGDNVGTFAVFYPNDRDQVPIFSNDPGKGTVTKKGEFVMLTSFGKKVKVPFSFTYQNNGPL